MCAYVRACAAPDAACGAAACADDNIFLIHGMYHLALSHIRKQVVITSPRTYSVRRVVSPQASTTSRLAPMTSPSLSR